MKLNLITCLLLIITSSLSLATEKVVYGEDNRLDLFEVTNPLYRKLARSTAGMVASFRLKKNILSDSYKFFSPGNLGKTFNLCSGELFAEQKLTASCSGFLIADNMLVTAGHCMTPSEHDKDPCKNNKWVFGLSMESSTSINLSRIPKKNIYSCDKILAGNLSKSHDFAVILLDRKVVERAPLKFRTHGKIKKDASLVVIGHPSMLPTKITDQGKILSNTNPTRFITNLDTFHGNSGSAVFDSKTGLLEGILIMGKTDYRHSRPGDKKSCQVVNTCEEQGFNCKQKSFNDNGKEFVIPGEIVQRITSILKQ